MAVHPIGITATPDAVARLVCGQDLAGKRVLDLGAGKGYLSRAIAQGMAAQGLTDLDGRLYAADLNPANFEFDGIQCQHGDFNQKLPYEDGFFDVVCLVEVIEHLEDQFSCIREIARILKPGGVAIVSTPNILNMNSRLRYFASGLFGLFNVLPYRHFDRYDMASVFGHINPVSLIHLAYILKRFGLTDIGIYTDRLKTSAMAWAVLFYLPIAIWAHFIFKKRRRKDPAIMADNEDIIGAVNSFPILTSRSIILRAAKTDS